MTAGLLEEAMSLPTARAAALYRRDGGHLVFSGGVGRAQQWAHAALSPASGGALETAMARGEPAVRADWMAPDGVVHEYSAILPLAYRVTEPQVLVVAGDTRDPFAALDSSFLVSLGRQLAAALDSAELLARLQERTDDLGRLSTRVVRHEEDERRRLSRELHDESAQVFSALKMQLGLLQERADGRESEGLARAMSLLDEGMRSIRSVTETLRPAVLDELGLMAALRSLVTDFSSRSPATRVTSMLPQEDWRLGPDVELALYRALQESLTNATRHANAQTVHVELTKSHGEVMLTVRDDGVGMGGPPSMRLLEHNGRRGLSGMQDRVAALGGRFELSMPEKGLQVSVTLPDTAE